MKDVFIIGAGASVPYGFPTGFDLLQSIKSVKIEKLPPGILGSLNEIHGGRRGIDIELNRATVIHNIGGRIDTEVLSNLRNSCTLSIDQFLKNHQRNSVLQKTLKSIMAYQILRAESAAFDNRFNPLDNKKKGHLGAIDWIQQFLTRVDIRFSDDTKLINYLRDTKFITFNYDRVLEYFLENFLRYDRNIENYYEVLSSINIYHINGVLGSLDDLGMGGYQVANYELSIESMRTVWEGDGTHIVDTNPVKKCVQEANRIFILGTSYIPDNNEAIGLNELNLCNSEVYGTALKLSKANITRVAQQLGLEEEHLHDRSGIKDISASDLIIDHYILN